MFLTAYLFPMSQLVVPREAIRAFFTFCSTLAVVGATFSSDANGNLQHANTTNRPTVFQLRSQRLNVSVLTGTPLSLSLAVDSIGVFSYEWMRKGIPISVGETLFVPSTSSGDSGQYSARVISPDGTATTVERMVIVTPTRRSFLAVTHGDRGFVALAESQDGKPFLHSPDGFVWEILNMTGASMQDVVYGEGRYVATGLTPTGSVIYLSADGRSWTSFPVPGLFNKTLAYGAGIFFGLGDKNGVAQYLISEDGLDFDADAFSGGNAQVGRLCFAGDRFIAQDGLRILYSLNGSNWSITSDWPLRTGIRGFAFGNGRYLAVGDGSFSMFSDDALKWQQALPLFDDPTRPPSFAMPFNDVIFVKGMFYAVGEPGVLLVSRDGEQWAKSDSWVDESLTRLTFGNELLLGFGVEGAIAALPFAPFIRITSPSDGSQIVAGRTLTLIADAFSPTGTIREVEFFVDSLPVGTISTPPFQIDWTPPNTSLHFIQAQATDERGVRSLSTVSAFGNNLAPKISRELASEVAPVDESMALAISVTGPGPFIYQWYANGSPIAGGSHSVLNFEKPKADNSGLYSVLIANRYGMVTSEVAQVVFTARPLFTKQPQNTSVTIGNSATLAFDVEGIEPMIYQWYRNETFIPNATNTVLEIPNSQTTDAGTYYARAQNGSGVTQSASASLTIEALPLTVSFKAFGIINTGEFQMVVERPRNSTIRVETSQNFVQWETLQVFPSGTDEVTLVDDLTSTDKSRFYRVVIP